MKQRLPDFAGVALVDILANGLAMLIIVIVLSIASRAEHEQRTTAQVEEVETMMSRRFSTSLILNSLAASPPARLHDYDNSSIDQEHDPYLLPILEFHRGFVREFYSGAIWSRAELLRDPNAMDSWLASFDESRKSRLRADIYDVAQFYLAMSILRDHGVGIRHWHFLSGGLNIKQAGRCPPGLAAKDCSGGAEDDDQPPQKLPSLTGAEGAFGEGDTWPPAGSLLGKSGGDSPFPGGASLGGSIDGIGAGTGTGSGEYGEFAGTYGGGDSSFPNAREGAGKLSGLLGSRASGSGKPGGTRFRLSSPESLRDGATIQLGDGNLTEKQILSVLMDFISKLQATLDIGSSPSALLENFPRYLLGALSAPPPVEGEARNLIDFLILQRWSVTPSDGEPLIVNTQTLEKPMSTTLVVNTNKLLQEATIQREENDEERPLPEVAHPMLRLHAHPDVWRGLSLSLEQDSILLLPPEQKYRDQFRWRAVAYVAPNFDDFIVGFAHAAIDTDGRLILQVEDNRVRINGYSLKTPYREAWFGARGWLATLYAGLVLGLLGFLWVRRVAAIGGRQ